MTVELLVLVLTACWTVGLLSPPLLARTRLAGGLSWSLGNRETAIENEPAWHGRAVRAHRNMVENLGPFAVIVLVAHLVGVHNAWTAGATVGFLVARVLHGVTYIAGLVPWRTYVFIAGLVCEVVLVAQIALHASFV